MSVKVKAESNQVQEGKFSEGITRFFKVIDKPGTTSAPSPKDSSSIDVANTSKPTKACKKAGAKSCSARAQTSGAESVTNDSSVASDNHPEEIPVNSNISKPSQDHRSKTKKKVSCKRNKNSSADKDVISITSTKCKAQNSIDCDDVECVTINEQRSSTVAMPASPKKTALQPMAAAKIPVSKMKSKSKLANGITKTVIRKRSSVPKRRNHSDDSVTVVSYAEFLKEHSFEAPDTICPEVPCFNVDEDSSKSTGSFSSTEEVALVSLELRNKVTKLQSQRDAKLNIEDSKRSKKPKRRRSLVESDVLPSLELFKNDNDKSTSKVLAATESDVDSASSKSKENSSDDCDATVVLSQINQTKPASSCEDTPNAKKAKRHKDSVTSESKPISSIEKDLLPCPKEEQAGPSLRRSSRLRNVVTTKVDDDSDEKESQKKLKEQKDKRSVLKSIRKNESCNGSALKDGLGKTSLHQKSSKGISIPLAPLFIQKAKKSKPNVDPVLLEKRKSFLMSGIPEKLQKHIQLNDAYSVSCAASTFPTIQHIQQRETLAPDSLWHLGIPKTLTGLSDDNGINISHHEMRLHYGMLTNCHEEILLNMVSETDVKTLDGGKVLEEIRHNYSSIDVMNVYEGYVQKRLRAWQNETNDEIRISESKFTPDVIQLCDDESVSVKKSEVSSKVRKGKRTKNASNGGEKNTETDTRESSTVSKAKDLTDNCSSDLWTTVHQPDSVKEIVGNAESVARLASWLRQWKTVCLNSWKKEQASSNRPSNKKRKKNGFSQLDSDYDNESDSSDQENDLCNTVMLLGPNGCGKTSAVFALAKEQGFEVIEVNAASKRTGKLVLSRLREATQSHRVSDLKSLTLSPSKVKSSFFSNISEQHINVGSTGLKASSGDQNKEKIDESRLAPMSLILFEDVDIVFAEDDGFWGAVNTFMASAKRPIILTSSDLKFSQRDFIKEKYEVVEFQRPDHAVQTLHLQLMALAELSFCPLNDVIRLVKSNNGDYRRSITMLQFHCKHRHLDSGRIWDNETSVNITKEKSLPGSAARSQPANLLSGPVVTECRGLQNLFCEFSISTAKLFSGYVKLLEVVESNVLPSKDGKCENSSESQNDSTTTLPQLDTVKELTRFSTMANSLVDLDVTLPEESSRNNAGVVPGLEDEYQVADSGHHPDLLVTAVDTFLSLQNSILKAENLSSSSEAIMDEFKEPITRSVYHCDKAPHNILSVMPLETRLHRRDFCLDYLPALRNICHSESFKNSTSTKRRGRFSHYLDSNVLYLDKDTISWLGTHFQEG